MRGSTAQPRPGDERGRQPDQRDDATQASRNRPLPRSTGIHAQAERQIRTAASAVVMTRSGAATSTQSLTSGLPSGAPSSSAVIAIAPEDQRPAPTAGRSASGGASGPSPGRSGAGGPGGSAGGWAPCWGWVSAGVAGSRNDLPIEDGHALPSVRRPSGVECTSGGRGWLRSTAGARLRAPCSPDPRRSPRPGSGGDLRAVSRRSGSASASISAARRPAFSPLPTPTVATGTPFGIWTIARSASRPSATPPAIGTPITGAVVCEASTPGQVRGEPGDCDEDADPAFLGGRHELREQVRRPVGGDHPDLGRHPELIENRGRPLGRSDVGPASDDDAHARRVLPGSRDTLLHSMKCRFRECVP